MKKYTLPIDLLALISTWFLSLSAKIELSKVLTTFLKLDPQPLQYVTVRDWLDDNVKHQTVRLLFESLFRVFTYVNDPNNQSMGAVVEQGHLANAGSVYYLHHGWQTLVDGLQQMALAAGVEIVTGGKVEAVQWDEIQGVHHLSVKDGLTYQANAVILAVGPKAALRMIKHSEQTELASWQQAARPVRSACLDIAVSSLPEPKTRFALGLDASLYYSVHSAAAKLGPDQGGLIHVAKYLAPDESVDAVVIEQELEAVMDLLQPGWQNVLVERRFMPTLTVSYAVVTAKQGGTTGRPGPAVPEIPGVYLAGDWVGAEGMLADASFASAKQAALMVQDYLSTLPDRLPKPDMMQLPQPEAGYREVSK